MGFLSPALETALRPRSVTLSNVAVATNLQSPSVPALDSEELHEESGGESGEENMGGEDMGMNLGGSAFDALREETVAEAATAMGAWNRGYGR